MLLDALEGGLVHGGHAGAVVLAGVARDVALQGHGPHARPEVVEARGADPEPVRQVRALASAVDSPTSRTPSSVCDEMKLVRDTITSRTEPLSSPGNSLN